MSNNNKQGINIILYPREYNKRGHENLHSVRGITSAGEEINVKLRIPDKYKNYENKPKISDLASKDPRSIKYCLASDFNSSKNREGVLLFSGAMKEPSRKNKIPTYVASWVEVLSNSSSSPNPIYGFGRMEINKRSKKTVSIQKQLSFHISNNSSQEIISDFEKEINDPKNFSYSSINYLFRKTKSFTPREINAIKGYFSQAIDNFTERGKVGGIMLRGIDYNGLVITSTYSEFFPKYSLVSSGVHIGKLTYENHKSKILEILKNKSISKIELMPLLKITTGPKSSEYYGEPDRFKRLKNTFFDNKNNPKVCKIVSRITEYADSESALLYKLFPLSIPLGHPAKLNKDGLLSLRLDIESSNSNFEDGELNLEGIEVGATRNKALIKRAYWLLGEDSNSIDYYTQLTNNSENNTNLKENKNIEESKNISNENNGNVDNDACSKNNFSADNSQVENENNDKNNESEISSIIESEGASIFDIDQMFLPENKSIENKENKENKEDIEDKEVNSGKKEYKDDNEPSEKKLTGMAAYLSRIESS